MKQARMPQTKGLGLPVIGSQRSKIVGNGRAVQARLAGGGRHGLTLTERANPGGQRSIMLFLAINAKIHVMTKLWCKKR